MRTGWGAKVMPNTFDIRFARAAGFAAAKKQLAFFEAETTKLRAEFTKVRTSPTADPIVALEQQWWRLTERIYTSPEYDDPAIRVLLHAELAVSRSWRRSAGSVASSSSSSGPSRCC